MSTLAGIIIGAVSLLLAALGIQTYRGKNARNQAEQATDRAKAAQAHVEANRRTQDAIEQVQEKHREEEKQVSDSLDAGRRDQLDGDW